MKFFFVTDPEGYHPGQPGKVWSKEEVDIVREKIMKLLGLKGDEKRTKGVTETVLFQLAFHDCLTYKDGSPGCDGCLNWDHMGEKPPSPFPGVRDRYCKHQFPKVTKTDNNGLAGIAAKLEQVYTKKDYPQDTRQTSKPLKELGISRADLWQFAANVALESTIERSDTCCRHNYWQRQQVPLLEDEGKGFAYGVWKCKIKLTKPIKMQFGRSDCLPTEGLKQPYMTNKDENHSNPHANIGEILKDVNKALGMSARDLIALTSIHGLIFPFGQGSIGTKYSWFGSGAALSNMYYKLLANRPTYLAQPGKGDNRVNGGMPMLKGRGSKNVIPVAIGDKDGNPVAHTGMFVTCSDCWNTTQIGFGGPCVVRPARIIQASRSHFNANKGLNGMAKGWENVNGKWERIENVEKHITYTSTGIQRRGTNDESEREEVKLQRWDNRFMLNYEAGLYRKFDVDPVAFRATGCPGINLEKPNVMWEHGSGKIKKGSNSVVSSPIADCPVQDLKDETGTPIAKITEEYADDHDVWAKDFLDAWHRMQAIKCPDLKDGPENSWLGYYSLKEMGARIGMHYCSDPMHHINISKI